MRYKACEPSKTKTTERGNQLIELDRNCGAGTAAWASLKCDWCLRTWRIPLGRIVRGRDPRAAQRLACVPCAVGNMYLVRAVCRSSALLRDAVVSTLFLIRLNGSRHTGPGPCCCGGPREGLVRREIYYSMPSIICCIIWYGGICASDLQCEDREQVCGLSRDAEQCYRFRTFHEPFGTRWDVSLSPMHGLEVMRCDASASNPPDRHTHHHREDPSRWLREGRVDDTDTSSSNTRHSIHPHVLRTRSCTDRTAAPRSDLLPQLVARR